ncbi:acetoacetate decarboxylase family protein [Lentzea sp. BCCO 10_0856]|uniref:Acetoacetate decarboxylase family protein n=1 Tax=Lentzea miocenica TaxID=3095431 RepID=A0ABU4THD7_9PSEU|nr:acetoacetate decarboxylase family protein [Lentzea sp. BCCO 10_0856]MDX8037419.1 acetoacetate decarboxylase family protein [Lentzea sp. BCCO 10_0856]
MQYPAEPWHMRGSLVISVFRVPRTLVPQAHLPSNARLISLAGNVFVAVAFVSYEPGSELTYEELLVATPVRDEGGVAVSVPQIWVDSEASRDGGREMWGIPKELARFGEGSSIAAVAVAGGVALPGRWTAGGWTAQRLDGRDVRTRMHMSGRVNLARTAWMFPVNGPLGYLTGRTPLVSCTMKDMRLTFGQRR